MCSRRYWPVTRWHQSEVNNGVEVSADPLVPSKGLATGWRNKWSWALVQVGPCCNSFAEDPVLLPYYPGYSVLGRSKFRRTIFPVTTSYFAFQIGPNPVFYSVFGSGGQRIQVEMKLLATHLTWSNVVKLAGGEREVTFV